MSSLARLAGFARVVTAAAAAPTRTIYVKARPSASQVGRARRDLRPLRFCKKYFEPHDAEPLKLLPSPLDFSGSRETAAARCPRWGRRANQSSTGTYGCHAYDSSAWCDVSASARACTTLDNVVQRYMKPTLRRQRNAKLAVYNKAKQQKDKLVEELIADPALWPF